MGSFAKVENLCLCFTSFLFFPKCYLGQHCKKTHKIFTDWNFISNLATTKYKISTIMKKLVLLFTAAATISMISCGNAEKAAQATDSTATDSTELVQADTISAEDFQAQLDELVAKMDTAGIKALLEKSQATIKQYADKSDNEAVKNYVEKVQQAIDKNTKTISAVYPSFSEIAKKAVSLPGTVVETAKNAGEQLADSAKSAAKKQVDNAVSEVKKNTTDKVKAAEEAERKKANDQIEGAQKKANDAVNKAADNVAKKLGL